MATSVALKGAAMSTTFDTTTTYAAAQCMDGSFNTLCATQTATPKIIQVMIQVKAMRGPQWSV